MKIPKTIINLKCVIGPETMKDLGNIVQKLSDTKKVPLLIENAEERYITISSVLNEQDILIYEIEDKYKLGTHLHARPIQTKSRLYTQQEINSL